MNNWNGKNRVFGIKIRKNIKKFLLSIIKITRKIFFKELFYFSFIPLSSLKKSFSLKFSLISILIITVLFFATIWKSISTINTYIFFSKKNYELSRENSLKKEVNVNLEKTLKKYLIHFKLKELYLENMEHLLVKNPKFKSGIGNFKDEKDWKKEIKQENKEKYEKKLIEQFSLSIEDEKNLFKTLKDQKKFMGHIKSNLKKFSQTLIKKKNSNKRIPFQWPISNGLGEIIKNDKTSLTISALAGSEIVATAAGEIDKITVSNKGIKSIVIKHPLGLKTVYSSLRTTLKKDDLVKKNQIIGITNDHYFTYKIMINDKMINIDDFTFIKY